MTPRNPTDGWMRSELERRGVSNRGTAYTSAQLRAMLKAAGLDLDAIAKKDGAVLSSAPSEAVER